MTRALQSLKKLYFNGLLLSKVYTGWTKKVQMNNVSWNWRYNISRGIGLFLQNWHKKFDKIWPEHSKVLKNFTLMGSFLAKYRFFELKKYRWIIIHKTEEKFKIWRGIDLLFQNCHKKLDKIWPERSKVSKNFILMDSYWRKYILFELKKVQRNNLSCNWRETQNLERNQLVVSKLA